jgi:hypothetical protein
MPCNNYCGTDVPEQLLNACGETLTGGGVQAIIFACDATTTDYSDETTIAADIAAGKAALFQNVKIGIPAPSPVAAGATYIAGQEPKTTTYTNAGTWMDQNANATNDAAYAALNATNGGVYSAILIKLADEATTGVLAESTKGIQFVGGMVVPDDVTDLVHYEFTFNYKHPTGTVTQVLPVGIFA